MLAIKSMKEVIKDWMFKFKGVIVESDNSNVISVLQHALADGFKGEEDFDYFNEFKFVIFKCIDRSSNKLADMCANFALISNFVWEDLIFNKIPPSFASLLKEESSL
ncbi:hypothetical protein IEQ34_020844 [Dendrobium chrysotoxum]|uniref:RNase H type-1 domain-containing protein n=1 Tax=Dendrobium chrysotoxum TaxID=161865 RepID=A0AAV7G3V4_DENCH|nr:hypothetical protein IEQ34_020844 [Dendrobium chrysotoxum]